MFDNLWRQTNLFFLSSAFYLRTESFKFLWKVLWLHYYIQHFVPNNNVDYFPGRNQANPCHLSNAYPSKTRVSCSCLHIQIIVERILIKLYGFLILFWRLQNLQAVFRPAKKPVTKSFQWQTLGFILIKCISFP